MRKKNLNVAIQAAISNPVKGLPRMAAVIAIRGNVKSIGLNAHKSDPLQKKFARNDKAICIHAEIAAIKNFLRENHVDDLKKSAIYVARVRKDGLIAKAAPCSGCNQALEAFGIKEIHWTEDSKEPDIINNKRN